MAGIYIHVPFCKQACHYCDFHFSTTLRQKPRFLAALKQEINQRRKEWQATSVSSIYFGGGTPSQLSASEIQEIIDCVLFDSQLAEGAEITLEANPDDLSREYLFSLQKTAINRLSIGIQSFREEDLTWMNRAHSSQEAIQCVKWAKEAGFKNITIDLIYGYPQLSIQSWQENLTIATDFEIPHISSYCLTLEEGTALEHKVKAGNFPQLNDDLAAEHFQLLVSHLEAHGYEQYEISNFALPNKYAKHNTSYWQGAHYVGLGPSAHSFNGTHRRWNVANNRKYFEGVENNQPFHEIETLSELDQYNERMLTGLRTQWGVDLKQLNTDFSTSILTHHQQTLQEEWLQPYLHISAQHLKLTKAGRLLADKIAAEFFIVSE